MTSMLSNGTWTVHLLCTQISRGTLSGGMTYGQGMPQTMSQKQNLNTRSSTEAELVGPDDLATMILWTKLFMEAQGYEIKKNILYQDNKSTILL
jgi:hypothetical protein